MVMKESVPVRGGVYMMNFDPTKGHEQGGFRPAVVISDTSYNQKVGLALICAITSARKGYPFEVEVEMNGIAGVVLVDQIRSIDWRARRLRHVGNLPEATFAEIQMKLLSMIR